VNIDKIHGKPIHMLRPKPGPISKASHFSLYPAKTFVQEDGVTVVGRTVLDHCSIVGKVAEELIRRFPQSIRDSLFPEGAPLVASTHDIGKVSPTFFEKVIRNCHDSVEGIERNLIIDPSIESQWGGHAGVSQLAALALGAPKYVPEILGQHHGYSPPIASYTANSDVFGGAQWQYQRGLLVDELKKILNMDWPEITSISQAKAIAGLTTVSDWIGSGHHFEDPALPWEDKIKIAIDDAGMIPATYRKNLSFEDVFGFKPRTAQKALIDAINMPGVYVLEGQMGLGKTEAALYAAYKVLDAGMARGIYFALPTQLTSNKIYDRFNNFLESILDPECSHRSLLLHGTAHLIEKVDMGEDAKPGGSWFNQSKRGLLAPFGTGTLDQALMSVMNVKHGFVRAFGLAGKVVILDEVHTYDAYTGTIMDALIKTLRELHCTVIILSATLSKDKREKMLGAPMHSIGYPLITACPENNPPQEIALETPTTHLVNIVLCPSTKDALDEALARASEGQQVLWIENTVKEAQALYLDVCVHANSMGIDVGLIHSKFTQEHRSEHEDKWVNAYGKPGWLNRGIKGRFLIGTQVLEQSIDIDADILVTRFCPTDMILQRLGRLWRHNDAPRHINASCEAWIIAPTLESAIESPEKAFGNSAFVYSPYVLCRALEVWEGIKQVSLPNDIRSLIERSYEEREELGLMKTWYGHMVDGHKKNIGRNKLGALAMRSLSTNGESTMRDDEAKTRYSSEETIDVLLVRGFSQSQGESCATLTLLDGSQVSLPLHAKSISKSAIRALSSTLMRQMVKCRNHEAPKPISQSVLRAAGLHHCLYLGLPEVDQASIRVAIVNKHDTIQSINGGDAHDDRLLSYRKNLGYQVKLKAT
jgi:CRISPR-associated endonuclease/helicase Cas3